MLRFNQVLVLLITGILFASCGNNKMIKIRNDEGQVQEQYSIDPETQKKDGIYKKFFPDGKVQEITEYKDGVIDGTRKLFSRDGDLIIKETYDNGDFDGPFYTYYPNGQVELEGQYEDNVMTGKWKKYYKSGALMEEVTMQNNRENGPFIEYYENGNLKAEGEYKDGDNEHGLLKLYNKEGVLVKKMDCEVGICQTIWEKKIKDE